MAKDDQHTDQPAGSSRRIDQWLWYARVVKSRTLAAELVTGGKVRLNRERIEKSSTIVKPGDVVTVTAHSRVRVLRVAATGVRRGPPAEAAGLFEDMSPPPEPRTTSIKAAPAAAREPGSGRPTKRERRETDKFQRGDNDGSDDD